MNTALAEVPCRYQAQCTKPSCPFSHLAGGSDGSSESYSANMTWTPSVPKAETSERVFVSGDAAEKIVEGVVEIGGEK